MISISKKKINSNVNRYKHWMRWGMRYMVTIIECKRFLNSLWWSSTFGQKGISLFLVRTRTSNMEVIGLIRHSNGETLNR